MITFFHIKKKNLVITCKVFIKCVYFFQKIVTVAYFADKK